jgi:hypothetical protein
MVNRENDAKRERDKITLSNMSDTQLIMLTLIIIMEERTPFDNYDIKCELINRIGGCTK